MNDSKLGQPWDTIDRMGTMLWQAPILGMEFGPSGVRSPVDKRF